MMKVLFWIDAGLDIGIGHLKRGLSLAWELKQNHHTQVTFLCNPNQGTSSLCREAGMDVRELPRKASKSHGFRYTGELAAYQTFDRIILDLRAPFTEEDVAPLTDLKTPIINIDNDCQGGRSLPVNIFPNLHFEPGPEWSTYRGALYHGPDYVILPHDFPDKPERHISNTPALQVLVTLGGSDPHRLTIPIIRLLDRFPDPLNITLVIGPLFKDPKALQAAAHASRLNYTVKQNLPNLHSEIQQTDIAICGFGVTLYEMAAAGIPTAFVTNHLSDDGCARRFENLGTGVYLDPDDLRLASYKLEFLIRQPEFRKECSAKGRKLTDRKGASRIAAIITSL
jgi:spore coat polysaccharide biosynthesis predicted glycosyltransferase SpsG